MKHIIVSHTDYCPFKQRQVSIDVTYAEIGILGKLTPEYVIGSYDCPYSEECPYPASSPSGLCTVAESAPKKPSW